MDADQEAALKIFFLAYAEAPQDRPTFNAWTKQQIREYRTRVIEQAQRQRDTNKFAPIILRELPALPLVTLGVMMSNMQDIHERIIAEAHHA